MESIIELIFITQLLVLPRCTCRVFVAIVKFGSGMTEGSRFSAI